jgi:hypothetical protein
MRFPFSADFTRRNSEKSAGERKGVYGGCSSVVTLFFAKKSLTKVACVLEHCREG